MSTAFVAGCGHHTCYSTHTRTRISEALQFGGYQSLSTLAPHTSLVPVYCLIAGRVHPPNGEKSENEGLLS